MAENTRKRPDFSSDHSSETPRDTSNDPLAELARLIGQSDPFTDIAKHNPRKPFEAVRNDDRPAPEWLARPIAPEHDDYDAQPVSQRTPTQPPYPDVQNEPDTPAAHAESAQHADAGDYPEQGGYDHYPPDDRYRVALPSGHHDPDSYYADDSHLPPQGEERTSHRGRGGLITIAAVVGLAVIGTAGAFGYRAFVAGGSAPANPPVIKADPTPPKTVAAPVTTASVDKPIQDRIGAMAAPERVVPREEQPVSLPTGPTPSASRSMAAPPSAQAAAPLVSPPSPISAASEPKKVKTVTIRQDNSGMDSAAMANAPAAAPAQQSRTPATKQSGTAPIPIAPQSDSAKTKVAARTPPSQAAGGAYVVQISAQKTEDEARASYQALQQKYPSVLSGREPIIRRAELGQSGTWYRVHIGSFATSEQATALCNNLKDVGGQCIVQKN